MSCRRDILSYSACPELIIIKLIGKWNYSSFTPYITLILINEPKNIKITWKKKLNLYGTDSMPVHKESAVAQQLPAAAVDDVDDRQDAAVARFLLVVPMLPLL